MPRPDERRDERPDEGVIHAWLDGELGADEAARVERLVAEDAEWAAAAAEARGLVAASTRILGALDVVAGNVIPRGGSAAGTFAPIADTSRVPQPQVVRRAVPTWMRVAAGIALVAGVGYVGLERSDERSASPEIREAAPDARRDVAGAVRGDAVRGDAVDGTAKQAVVSAVPRPERRVRPTAPSARTEADFSMRDASIAAPVTAATAAPSAPQPPTPSSGAGVAGGVASGVVSRSAVESNEMLGNPGAALEREARAKTLQRALTPTPSAQADRMAENVAASSSVSGCWRAQTTARIDSVQSSMRIVRTAGDTLVLALTPPGAEARVVRESADVLRGQAREAAGTFVAIVATRIGCVP